ncbi:MAG TPA: hypothetical protein PK264_01410 [Hyphomicrobiaceae bacterium]|nr:hypothetical protein [Hyphomicrobiaceae bacterium]
MEQTIHIHEDDWGLRNLYPLAAFDAAVADVAAAEKAGRDNVAPDGIGWTSVHLIQAPKVDFTATGLAVDAVAPILERLLPWVRRFVATSMAGFSGGARDPYGSYEDDAWCFGFGSHCFVKLEPAGVLVRQVWFEARTSDPYELGALRTAIEAIDGLAGAMIADYVLEAVGRVRDRTFMERYLSSLADGA